MNLTKEYAEVASLERTIKVARALEDKGFIVDVAEDAAAAKAKALELIPKGAEVFTLQSATLQSTGIWEAVEDSGDYKSVRNQLNQLDRGKDGRQMRKLGSTPDYAIGSVHAITEDGAILIASNTGSQLAADASGAGQVIFVVGTQKLVKDLDEGLKRIYEYSLELEQERIEKLFPGFKTSVNKVLIINKESTPDRINIILVKENLGF